MTDAVAATPLQITIHPLPQAAAPDIGRLVNANPVPGTIPDNPQFWGQNGLSFKSVLDTVNPLQHIPVVSMLYQALTGDTPSSGSNIAGGILYGGPIGLITSLINEVAKTQTGKDVGGNLVAMLRGESSAQVAQNDVSADATPYLSPNQRASYSAYVRTQNMTT